jgi:hypothetical protein
MGATDEPPAMRRLFEGWQLGLLAVALPLLAVWLALPRPVAPARLPVPQVDRRSLARGLAADAERARSAARERLPFSVRRVGELVRRFGGANANEATRLRNEARFEFQVALAEVGAAPLLGLRAVQTALFVSAVRRMQERGRGDRELLELAGNFEEKCRAAAWLDERGRIVFSEAELFTLYRVRWTELVGALDAVAFRPSLQELRSYYRALLEHPEGTSAPERDAHRLLYVRALGQKDPEYPADLARGVLFYRLGQRAAAATALTEHLTEHPDGPYALSARNYLLAALAEGAAGE